MGGGPLGNRRTAVGSGACPSAQYVLYPPSRSRVSRHAPGQALHVSRLALSVARLCRTYLSALLPWETRKVVEALWPDRPQARLSLVWHSASVARRDTGNVCQSCVEPRLRGAMAAHQR